MIENATDKEQIEMLKKWWNDYGRAILIAVIIGLGIGFGWRYWQSKKVKEAQYASQIYQALTVANAENNIQDSQRYSRTLEKEYSETPYAALAALAWAKNAAMQSQLDSADTQLRWVLKNSKVPSLREIARLRLARVLIAKKNLQGALQLVATVDDKAFTPLVDAIKGDIYLAMRQKANAQKYYQQAQAGFTALGITDPLLNIKLASVS